MSTELDTFATPGIELGSLPPSKKGIFQLWQDEILVASSQGAYSVAYKEIMSYVGYYEKRGSVKIIEVTHTEIYATSSCGHET
jgi:hypothetical protein